MYHGVGHGGGGGGHGGGGHGGGGGHHGGGGGHHGGGGGHHGGGGRRGGRTVVVQNGGGWGPGWYGGDASYPYPVAVGPDCAVVDQNGDCVCQLVDSSGACMAGMGSYDNPATDPPAPSSDAGMSMGSPTSWITGGIIFGLAIAVFWFDTKDPLGFKKAA